MPHLTKRTCPKHTVDHRIEDAAQDPHSNERGPVQLQRPLTKGPLAEADRRPDPRGREKGMCHGDVPGIPSNEDPTQERPEKNAGGAGGAGNEKRHDSCKSRQEYSGNSVWDHCQLLGHQ